MTKWAEILIPVLLSAMGIIVFGLFDKVDRIETKQGEAIKYVNQLTYLEKRSDDYEVRICLLTRRMTVLENTTCNNCKVK